MINEQNPFKNVHHINGGIPDVFIDTSKSPEENLVFLLPHLARLGIHIPNSCKITNSTLKNLMFMINSNLKVAPDFDETTQIMFGNIETYKNDDQETEIYPEITNNFAINIGENVTLEEGTYLYPNIQIGSGTKIGKKVHILSGTIIGKGCNIGDFTFVNRACVIGNNVTTKNSTIFPPKTHIPDYAIVDHKGRDSTVASIIQKHKLRLVQSQ